MTGALLAALAVALPWWLGLHLLARGAREVRTRRVAAGLLAYAAVAALDLLALPATAVARDALALAPVLLWGAALPHLLPERDRWRAPLLRLWRALLPLAGGVLIGALAFGASGAPVWRLALRLDGALLLALLLVQGARLVASARADPEGRAAGRVRVVAALATLFVALAGALLLLPEALPRGAVLLATAFDFAVLGIVVAGLDGLERGERWLPELRRDALAALAAALLFGGQVTLALGPASAGAAEAERGLLLAVVLSATAVSALARPLGALLDAAALAGSAVRERATLRDAEAAAARRSDEVPGGAPDGGAARSFADRERFARHTRRALSLLRDPGKLGSSPLAGLPLVAARTPPGATTLERAHALAAELRESVARLRPPGASGFDPGDAARSFNVLHYPYVAGLRPYSRQGPEPANADEAAALEWFRTQVPERTFYHWQREAAALVARDLLERSGIEPTAAPD